MATAGRRTNNTNIEKGHFGPIPGIEVGQRWQYRIQLSENGVHAPPGENLLWFAIENHQDPFYVVNWHFSRRPDRC